MIRALLGTQSKRFIFLYKNWSDGEYESFIIRSLYMLQDFVLFTYDSLGSPQGCQSLCKPRYSKVGTWCALRYELGYEGCEMPVTKPLGAYCALLIYLRTP